MLDVVEASWRVETVDDRPADRALDAALDAIEVTAARPETVEAGEMWDAAARDSEPAETGTIETWSETAKTGVLARPTRSSNGQFLPGNPGGPGGTKKDTALVAVLNGHFPPDVVLKRIEDTYTVALARGSWRGMLETIRLVLEYTIGKPKQQIQSVKGTPEQWQQWLDSLQLGGDTDAEP